MLTSYVFWLTSVKSNVDITPITSRLRCCLRIHAWTLQYVDVLGIYGSWLHWSVSVLLCVCSEKSSGLSWLRRLVWILGWSFRNIWQRNLYPSVSLSSTSSLHIHLSYLLFSPPRSPPLLISPPYLLSRFNYFNWLLLIL